MALPNITTDLLSGSILISTTLTMVFVLLNYNLGVPQYNYSLVNADKRLRINTVKDLKAYMESTLDH